MKSPWPPRRWPDIYRTKAGTVVTIVLTRSFYTRSGATELKALTYRHPSRGRHGWVWLRNLTRIESARGKQ